MNVVTTPVSKPSADASLLEDMKLAASKMLGEARRSFQAAMAIKYCGGRARQAEAVFGWNRRTVELGLHERRTGIICLGCHEAFCGNTLWEEKHPEAAKSLWALAQTQSQQDPTFRTTLSYTRLTAAQALKQLRELGIAEGELPSPSTMAEILNRNGYRLRPVIKADNGPESNGRRTQFLNRIVEFSDHIGKPIQLLYYPPYHSKYNPVERCWGVLEKHWNGSLLSDVDLMLEWAKSMTWKGIHPVVHLSKTIYEKGITLSKAAMRTVEARLERNPCLPKWDILIRPV